MSHLSRHTRRRFLRQGMAGVALPPLVSLMGASQVAHGDARPPQKPARLVTIFFPNGVSLPPEGHKSFQDWHWFPHHTGTDYVMTKTLQPLAEHRGDR